MPSPRVRFEGDFLARLGAFARRLSAARERREGAGSSGLFGVGAEFVGYRPYRPGEDLRLFDWNLFARHKRPFVRVSRREASEHWAVLLDTSASMGVGVGRGKLQAAAELATAIAALGSLIGADVQLWTSGALRGFRLRRWAELTGWMRFLEDEEAAGERGLAALVGEGARFRKAGRLFLVGDFFDLEPRDVGRLARRGRELFALRVVAHEELVAHGLDGAELVDPETGERLVVHVDADAESAYDRRLEALFGRWRTTAARQRIRYGVASARTPFEDVLREVVTS